MMLKWNYLSKNVCFFVIFQGIHYSSSDDKKNHQ